MSHSFSPPDRPDEASDFDLAPLLASPRARLLRSAGVVLLFLAFLLALYGTIAYTAWQKGQQERAERAREALQQEILRQMSFAEEDVNTGNYTLALRRLEWILERNPDYPGAGTLYQQATEGENALLTPLAMPAPAPTSPAAEPTGLPSSPELADELAHLQELVEAADWAAAVEAIIAFQTRFPNYERRYTDKMLYESYINLGLTHLAGDQLELGLFYLDQAERLGDLPESALDQRSWAELYLRGIAFYGVDWPTAIFYFRDLCRAAPFFQNACDKLYEALVAYGDQFADEQEWCPAQPLYAEAQQYHSNATLSEKFRQAVEGCLAATPTPEAPITDTLPITNTLPVTDPNTVP